MAGEGEKVGEFEISSQNGGIHRYGFKFFC